MDIAQQIEYLNKMCINQKNAVRTYLAVALGLFIIGILVALFGHIFGLNDIKWLLTGGGTFFSSLSGVPVREIFLKKDKIASVELLLNQFKLFQNLKNQDNEQLSQLQTLFMNYWKKNIGIE